VFSGDPVLYFSKSYQRKRDYFLLNTTKNNQSFISISVPSLDTLGETSQYFNFWDTAQTVYILVWSGPSHSANYSISYLIGKQASTLHSGIVDFASIRPQQNKTYVFKYFDENIVPSLMIHTLGPNALNLSIKFKFQKQADPSDFSNKIQDFSLSPSIITSKSLGFDLPNKYNGTWIFDITNLNDTVNISINANSRDVNFVPLNVPSTWMLKSDIFFLDIL
jgi:hypothetical protein